MTFRQRLQANSKGFTQNHLSFSRFASLIQNQPFYDKNSGIIVIARPVTFQIDTFGFGSLICSHGISSLSIERDGLIAQIITQPQTCGTLALSENGLPLGKICVSSSKISLLR